ncbi:GNAT family N-acetyltransferase [Halalkalibacter urbisdiaboli]|uniref:GNAT family N-acetyltransferase n=1 Tax=Halalkalibacter urbisdiaboli TaxID=1960589 RepID=UPI000B43436C|nr:GNAT family N-acetyltransferase [Halalkalibacter urbisdiaboli]
MTPDKATMRYWADMRRLFPDYQLCLLDGEQLVGVGNSIPLTWSGKVGDLPKSWTDTLINGVDNRERASVNTLSAVNIAIHSDYQKSGLSQRLLSEFKKLAQEKELGKLIVPVRPSFKEDYPLTPVDNYIHWKRDDGEPFDPWIRTHWRLGAKILKPIYQAYTVKGTIMEWEEWTNMKFPESGSYVIKGALQPIEISHEQNIGVYHDPNVWMEYE